MARDLEVLGDPWVLRILCEISRAADTLAI